MTPQPIELDAVIFGGGAAGLWLLDELHRAGSRVLVLESEALGSGQTIASQGIIHGGIKYSLGSAATSSARAIRDMPGRWRSCLDGSDQPDLSAVTRRADHCHLWHTRSIRSRIGAIGASAALSVSPVKLEPSSWPAALRRCPGRVYRLDEQVIDPASFIEVLARRHAPRQLKYDFGTGLAFGRTGPVVDTIRLAGAGSIEPISLAPRCVVLAAGAGNASLRRRLELPDDAMQRRPLHMVMMRGRLPDLNGHCTDGARTRVTITTAHDAPGPGDDEGAVTDGPDATARRSAPGSAAVRRAIWQLGGQVAEDGVDMDRPSLIRYARAELTAVVPDLDLSGVAWSTYRVDRAEGATTGRGRPSGSVIRVEGNVVTAWPTKLALVPDLAANILAALQRVATPHVVAGGAQGNDPRIAKTEALLAGRPRASVARPPWEACSEWNREPLDAPGSL